MAPDGLELKVRVELEEGENAWSESLALGSVEGSVVGDLQSDPTIEYKAEHTTAAGVKLRARAVVRPGSDGRFALTRVLSGAGDIGHYGPRSGGGVQWTVLKKLNVAAGQVQEVELH